MALITKLTHRPDARCGFRTEVEAGYAVAHIGERRIARASRR
jgi:hypothetical protein